MSDGVRYRLEGLSPKSEPVGQICVPTILQSRPSDAHSAGKHRASPQLARLSKSASEISCSLVVSTLTERRAVSNELIE